MPKIGNPKTTITGLSMGALTLAQMFGLDLSAETVTGVLGAAVTLLGLFGKDNNKE